MKPDDFAAIMAALAALYPRFELQAQTIRAYHAVLDDIPRDILRAAALDLGATSKWFPTASELRGAAFALLERSEGVPCAEDAFREAWAKCLPPGYGGYGYSHPLVGQAAEAVGGWQAFHGCPVASVQVLYAHFTKAYNALLHRQQEDRRRLPAVREFIEGLPAPAKALGQEQGDGAERAQDEIARLAETYRANKTKGET